ncbi:MAG: ChaN family lipoprotein [Mucilaginibacter sp.]|uniref:ChaN family lipoprotein n=1 Tax=Mucilaginibacter sp. TaxID=1882438 RepID=UPI0034E389C7
MKIIPAKRSIATFILLFAFCVDAFPQDASSYKIYQTSTKKTITIDEMIKALNKTDAVFFGEEHNDSVSHVLEATILQKLNEAHLKQVALSMEMFETDCQNVLNEYLAGLIREKNFVVDARAWPNYKDYRPLIEYAKTNYLPMIAANAPSRYTNMASRMGLKSLNQLDKVGKSYLPPLPIDTATGTYLTKFDEIMGGHAMGGLEMYQAQNLWDATMGWSVASFLKTHPGFTVFHINGGFHSEEKLGAVAQFKKYLPQASVKNIAAYGSEDFNKPDWNKLGKMGDFVIVTNCSGTKGF